MGFLEVVAAGSALAACVSDEKDRSFRGCTAHKENGWYVKMEMKIVATRKNRNIFASEHDEGDREPGLNWFRIGLKKIARPNAIA